MKIAQIAPPWIACPPPGYGGIEWVVSMLADGLANNGHDVTLFASGGSKTTARLESVFDPAPGPSTIGNAYLEVLHAFHAYGRAKDFDIVHDHSGMVGLAMGAQAGLPVVHTLHGPQNAEALRWYRMIHDRVALVSISDSQTRHVPDLRIAGRVYNGIPLDLYPFREEKEDFLLFVGRANPEKGCEVAVEVARRTGARLVMAVAIKEEHERAYWREVVEPVLTGKEEILGEITVEEKAELMARAKCVLFPIQWEEPFGLVMAEANASGTPVVGFRRGAVPEVIADGVSGFVVDTVEEMCAALDRLGSIDAAACRAHVEERFGAQSMVKGYEDVYEGVLAARRNR
jgi:glycosyltransferase involved in cell wall biosynthesis